MAARDMHHVGCLMSTVTLARLQSGIAEICWRTGEVDHGLRLPVSGVARMVTWSRANAVLFRLFLSLSLSMSTSVSLCLSVSVSVSLSLSLSVCLSVSLSPCLFLSVCLSVCLSLSLSLSLSHTHMHTLLTLCPCAFVSEYDHSAL